MSGSKSLPVSPASLLPLITSLKALPRASPARKEHPDDDDQPPDSPGHQEDKQETGVGPASLPQVRGAKQVMGESPRLSQVH